MGCHVKEPVDNRPPGALDRRARPLVERDPGGEVRRKALGQLAVKLDVELQAVGVFPGTEGLVGVEVAFGEAHRAVRQIEGVFVPVEDGDLRPARAEDGVGDAAFGQRDSAEPDLAGRTTVDGCPQGACQQLRAQADAQDRQLAVDSGFYQRLLGGEEGVFVGLIDSHRAAHDNEPADLVCNGRRIAPVHAANLKLQSALGCPACNQAGSFVGDMLDYRPVAQRRFKLQDGCALSAQSAARSVIIPRMPTAESSAVPGELRSWWLREALAADPDEQACPPLAGEIEADVCVLGGGYTGLWTALALLERSPEVSVVVLEADVCGGGASGRNGGFVSAFWDYLPLLRERYGDEAAVAVCRATSRAVASIGEWCTRHDVDAWYRHAGYLRIATNRAQQGRWRASVAACREVGHADELVALSAAEVRARCDSPRFMGGVLMRDGATVQPARLARGLRRVAIEQGVRIHERTAVVGMSHGQPAVVRTGSGSVRAGQVVVALNAWATQVRELGRRITPVSNYMVITEPIPDRLEEIGWMGGEAIADYRIFLHYMRTTSDGRVAIGGGGGQVGFDGRIGRRFTHDARTAGRAERGLRCLLPQLGDVRAEAAWGGPIDIAPSRLPMFGTLPSGNLHFGVGYSGNGVCPSYVGGRILAGLCLGQRDEYTTLPIAQGLPAERLPPEPLRYLGARLVRAAVAAVERAEEEGRRPGGLARRVAGLPSRLGMGSLGH